MRVIVYAILLTLILSCRNNRKEEFAKLVATWQHKEILFPNSLIFTTYGTDTVNYSVSGAPYKVVVYADSIGCISCKLQLDKWKTFIAESDSLTGGTVPFLFFMDTRNIKDMKHVLRRERFSHPVCIDIESSFSKLNKLPPHSSFDAFLLDENNRVLLIGNPAYNMALKELYIKEFQKLRSN